MQKKTNRQTKAEADSWATVRDGNLVMANKTLSLPGLRLGKELGRGANAVVFDAVDTLLNRSVAVKVWNSKGKRRAQAEASKIARLHHPLVVTTHSIQWIDGYPYSVMELIAGESGKKWLASNPPIRERVRAWELYSRALRYVHSQGAVHGDPHVGNILVYRDTTGHFHDGASDNDTLIGVKVADAGTSEFLATRTKLLKREADLILETATRLFYDQNVDRLWSHPEGLTYQQTLEVLDSLAKFIKFTTEFPSSDWAAENAEKLVRFVLDVPLFNLDGVLENIRSHRQTTCERFSRRLSRELLNLRDWLDVDGLTQEVREKYLAARSAYFTSMQFS